MWVLCIRVTKYTGKKSDFVFYLFCRSLSHHFFIFISIMTAFSVSKWASKHATKYTNTFHKMFHIIFFFTMSVFFLSCLVISRSIRLFLSAFLHLSLIAISLNSFVLCIFVHFFHNHLTHTSTYKK